VSQFIRKHGVFARSVATLAGGFLLLQIVFAGFAVASVNGGADVYFGVTCAPQKAASDGGQPAGPRSGHQHGLCCILHSAALDAPDIKPVSALVIAFPDEAVVFAAFRSAPALLFEPESAPQSPRAPPSAAA